jgi:chromosome segregation ATPase
VTVDAGPSFATKRQEAVATLKELMAAAPQLMQIIGDDFLGSLDVDMAEHMSERVRKTMPPALLQGEPGAEKYQAAQEQLQQLQQLPMLQQQMEQAQKQLMQMQEAVKSLTDTNQQLNMALTNKQAEQALESRKLDLEAEDKRRQANIKAYEAETDRLKVAATTQNQDVQGGPYE